MKVKENTKILDETRERKSKWQDLNQQNLSLKNSERDQSNDPEMEFRTQSLQEDLH